MILTPHLLSGMTFGTFSDNVFLAFFLGALSYIFIELIPHWDPENKNKKFVKVLRVFDFIFAPLALLSVVVSLLYLGDDYTRIYNMLAGGVAATFIYIILYVAFFYRGKGKFLQKMSKFHRTFKNSDRTVWGVLVQLAVCIICITLLFELIHLPTIQEAREVLFR